MTTWFLGGILGDTTGRKSPLCYVHVTVCFHLRQCFYMVSMLPHTYFLRKRQCHNQPMRLDQLHLLAFSLNGKIYINSSLPFGATSSCLIFEKVATALQWIVTHETGNSWISHFLDDFPLLGLSHQEVQQFIDEFCAIMQDIGMPVAEDKTLGPTQILEYLGLILNFAMQTVEIPDKKRIKCQTAINKLLSAYRNRQKVTVKDI